jgi:CBS domain containing-hemolysin-like protein
MIIDQTYESGFLSKEPVDMIRGIFDLSETSAAAVMTPRTEVVAIPADVTLDQAAEAIIEARHSRIPVYEDNLDHVVGVILAREVWEAQRAGKTKLRPLVRPASFIPESKSVEDLLRDMQEERIHIAIIVDEFGGTAGIVTIEDLLEEIVGEIRDEHEEVHEEILDTDESILITGAVPVDDLNDRFGLKLPEEDYNTVAGYVMSRLGRIARQGDEIDFEGGRLRVLAMDGLRIDRLALALADPDDGDMVETGSD